MVDILKLRKMQKKKSKPHESAVVVPEENLKEIPTEMITEEAEIDNQETDSTEITEETKVTESIGAAEEDTFKPTEEKKMQEEKHKLSIMELLEKKKKELFLESENDTEPEDSEIGVKEDDEMVLDSESDNGRNDEPEAGTIREKNKDSEKELNGDIVSMITVYLGQHRYAMNLQKIQEVIRINEITRVPNLEDYFCGVINLRGKITPVIDLRAKFELNKISNTKDTRIVIIDINHEQAGLLVDSVSDIVKTPINSILPPPAKVINIDHKYIKGIINLNDGADEQLIIVLNLDEVIR